ncbi:MAG: TetR/AcrR family transcriptional regulator [Vicinamibacterales bacterium]
MTQQTRRARQRAQLRQEILDTAREMLVREGFEHLSLRKVAERIGYSPTAMYLHFDDKRDLVYHVCQDTFGRLVQELTPLESEFKDPSVRLRAAMRRYIEFGLRHPQHYLAALVAVPPELLPDDVAKYNDPDSPGMRFFALLRGAVVSAMDGRRIRKVDPDVTTRALWAAVHGVTSMLIQLPHFLWGDQRAVVDNLLDSLIDGLRPRR